MNKLLLAVALWVGLIGAVWARTVEEQLLATLRTQGYEILEQGYTFLGRLRVVAQNGQLRREIVINPGTGEILRDYAVMLPGIAGAAHSGQAGATAASNPAQGTGRAATSGVTSSTVSTSGQSGGEPPVVTNADNGTDSLQIQSGDPDEGGAVPEMVLVDPILPFSVDGQ